MPQKRIIPRFCRQCGKHFLITLQAATRGNGLYCTRVCHRRYLDSLRSAPVSYPDESVGIPLHARDGSVHAYAIVDADDVNWLNQWRWSISTGYAQRTERINGKDHALRMSRVILGLVYGDGFEGDHINRNRLDNRRNNLRAVTKMGNRQNHPSRGGSSVYRGVSWSKDRQRWIAHCQKDGISHHVGSFTDELEAAEAAKAARARLMPYAID